MGETASRHQALPIPKQGEGRTYRMKMAPADDVIRSHGTYLQMTSPEIYSRRFSEFVRHFHSDDFTDTPQLRRRLRYTTTFKSELARLNKRRDARPVAAEPTKRQRRKVARAGSEPTLFPPISTPQGENDQSSPLENNVQSFGDITATLPSKDDSPSPVPKRDTQRSRNTNSLSVDKSQELVRLSPIVTSEKKSKPETKQEKNVALTPRGSIPKINSRSNLVEKAEHHHRGRGKQKTSKSKANDEPFSVRRKIEQYRRWHEEQYLQKLKRLKQDTETDGKGNEGSKCLERSKESREEIDLVKLLGDKTQEPQSKLSTEDDDNNDNVTIETVELQDISFKKRANRLKSAKTWKTWRDVNESDAYSDVQKYIEDNELMNSEKESWIKAWICEVERALCTSVSLSESDSV